MNNPEPIVFKAGIRMTQGGLCQGSNGEGIIVALEVLTIDATPELFAELWRLRREELVVTVMRAGEVKKATGAENPDRQQSDLPSPESTVKVEIGSTARADKSKTNTGQIKRKTAKPKDERTEEQKINGQAFSTLLYHTPEFLHCPGVAEDVLTNWKSEDGDDPKPAILRAWERERTSFISEDEALERYQSPNAQHHIRAAWRAARAKVEAKGGTQ